MNALRCDQGSQLHQLIDEIAKHLQLQGDRDHPAAYQKQIDHVLTIGKMSRSEPDTSLSDQGLVPPFPKRLDKVIIRCIKSDNGYNQGEVAGFTPDKAKELVASGKWIALNSDLLRASQLLLIEFKLLQKAYDRSDDSAMDVQRQNLSRAVDGYLSATHNYPVPEVKQFHLKVFRSLAEAVELEKERYPMGLSAFADPLHSLGEWVEDEELEARRRDLL